MSQKKVVVVGAGLSGLSAAIYAALSGFDVTVLEQHFTFGGASTSWKRKGYYFEGGMHWLTGSSEKMALNKIWKEVGALGENNPVEFRDPYYTVWDGGAHISMYRDLERMREEFLAYAPEDAKMIRRFYRDVKAFTAINMNVANVRGLKSKVNYKFSLKDVFHMIPAGLRLKRLSSITHYDYVNKFKNKNLRHLLNSVNSYSYNATSFIYTVAAFEKGDNGYPKGGSVQMGQNMVDRLISLGGKIQYKTQVQKIVVENGHAIGVQTKDAFIPADAVVVSQDAVAAVDALFDECPKDKWIKTMKRDTVPEQDVMISLGVKMDFSNLPDNIILPLDEPFEYAGMKFYELRINNYGKYKEYAPEGCSAMTCLLLGESYDFWKAAQEDGTYKDKKDEVAQKLIDVLEVYFPGVKDAVEVIDVATPCTYERYISSYKGSWMSVWEPKGKRYSYPQKCEIEGVYFAGQRMQIPGGTPIAVHTGRKATQLICRDWDVPFGN